MIVSRLTDKDVLSFLRLDGTEGDIFPSALLAAALGYVKSYTGLSEEEMDAHEDLSIAVLILCSDLYENRLTAVDTANVNRTVSCILGMHCKNLI